LGHCYGARSRCSHGGRKRGGLNREPGENFRGHRSIMKGERSMKSPLFQCPQGRRCSDKDDCAHAGRHRQLKGGMDGACLHSSRVPEFLFRCPECKPLNPEHK
jgi:hypothetical protein